MTNLAESRAGAAPLIDLNEIPPTPPSPGAEGAATPPSPGAEARALVALIHANPTLPSTPAAPHPGEAGVGPTPCALCGRPEIRGATVVCDGCDRGFHVACARYRPSRHGAFEDWLCSECSVRGGVTKRWGLGGTRMLDISSPPPPRKERMIDMNAPPPTDMDVDAVMELPVPAASANTRLKSSHGASSSVFSGQFQLTNMDHVRTALESGKYAGVVVGGRGNGSDSSVARPDNGLIISRGFEDPVFGSSIVRHAVTNATVLCHLEEDMLMQSLREFITERGSVLGEGWHVEYKESTSRSNRCALYCAPDGKKFESIYDVAQYLGPSSSFTYLGTNERVGGYDIVQGSMPPRRRKKYPSRIPVLNGSLEKQDSLRSSCGDIYSDYEAMKPQYFDARSAATVTKSSLNGSGDVGSQDLLVGLPIQFEDFFVVSLGKVDLQTSYHDKSQIWPIGYKCSWHDKITGSLFECEVSDGGESGPVFRIRRCSCSVLPIPNGVTVLIHKKTNSANVTEKGASSMNSVACCDHDDDIQLLLSDSNPSELDILSCLNRDYGETVDEASVPMDIQPGISTPDLNCLPDRSIENVHSSLGDEIGEFYVEGRSSCSVWTMVSKTLIETCREAYKQSGSLHFICRHNNGQFSPSADGEHVEVVDLPSSLMKFCCASGPIDIPRAIKNAADLEVSCKSVAKWIDQDRFGLDMGFVQEIIENLPGSRACSFYQLLNERSDSSTSLTVGSGSLLPIQKTEQGEERVSPYSLFRAPTITGLEDSCAKSIVLQPPQGRPLSTKLPAQLVGDVLQILEFLSRFSEILGLKEPLLFEEIVEELIDPWPCVSEEEIQAYKNLSSEGIKSVSGPEALGSESDSAHGGKSMLFVPVKMTYSKEATETKLASRTYARCHGVSLTKIHMSLLKVLIAELLCRVTAFVDPNCDAREIKPRRGRKKDVDNSLLTKETKMNILLNEMTWPELARRYILAMSSMNGLDSSEVCSRKGVKVFRCLQGDGGVLCGSLSGVAGMEADASILANIERQMSDPSKREKDILLMDYKDSHSAAVCEAVVVSNTGLPEWALPLEPVRKLPTNVGTRIRKCVYESLDKNPPAWARKILEHSISKEVYKGNASGPTKKAVLSVLAEASGATPQQPKPERKPKQSRPISVSDAIMRKCRIVLRHVMLADTGKVFCNLLGTTLDNSIDSKDDGVICPPALVSRPLDFRMIDLRLAIGAYAGSHEAFIQDVREIWHTIRMAHGERPDLMQLVGTLEEKFEALYEEVLNVMQKYVALSGTEHIDPEAQKELHDILLSSNEMPKAPWEEGVCKVCGIDRDDDSVLLCDTCDSEYHRYCLDPPLPRIPEGNWYCSSCVATRCEKPDAATFPVAKKQDAAPDTQFIRPNSKRGLGAEARAFQDSLNLLASKMEDGEYWEFSTEERIFLLKFLCDEVLNSVLIRDHLEQCTDKSNDLQQKIRSLSIEWKNLQGKADFLALMTEKESASRSGGSNDAMGVVTVAMYGNQDKLDVRQQINDQLNFGTFSGNPSELSSMPVDDLQGSGQNNSSKNLDSVSKAHSFSANCISDTNIADSMHTSDDLVVDKSPTSGNLLPLVNFSKTAEVKEEVGQSFQVTSQHIRDEQREEVVSGVESKSHGCLEMTYNANKGQGSMLQSLGLLRESYIPSDSCTIPTVSGVNISVGDLLHQGLALERNHYSKPIGMTEFGASFNEITSLKNEIFHLQESITTLQSQLMMTSSRREFLGRDSCDRLYWVVGRPGKRSWLVVDGSISTRKEITNANQIKDHYTNRVEGMSLQQHLVPESTNIPSGSNADGLCNPCPRESLSTSSSWVLYESDYEIRELVNWLRNSDPRERELKENILLWQKFGYHQQNNITFDVPGLPAMCSSAGKSTNCDYLATKAAAVLEARYGHCLDLDIGDAPKKRMKRTKTICEDRIYRCECLEPVWPSRHHCLSCHQSFCTAVELQGHTDGRCTPSNLAFDESKVGDESSKGKGARSDVREKENFDEVSNVESSKSGKLDIISKLGKPRMKLSPCDIDEVCKNFITQDSNKELVQKIGLIGSNGIPSFIPSPNFFLDPPLLMNRSNDIVNLQTGSSSSNEQMQLFAHGVCVGANTTPLDNEKETVCVSVSPQNCVGIDTERHLSEGKRSTLEYTSKGEKSLSMKKMHGTNVRRMYTVPEPSLRPLLGKISQLLKRLKTNLLDMEAALPEEALRPLKAHSLKRCAWRAYVKSAESIFEMVQATILFEGMIKTEYLKNGWWYWSSLSAAARTPTVSSLALRIYTLDHCITYDKDSLSASDPMENMTPINKTGKKRKDLEAGS